MAIQAAFTLFCVYTGFRFVLFLNWVAGKSDTFAAKPGAVEGFLPISGLLGLRKLLDTGQWDDVHPAGLSIFVAVLIMAFLFRKGFCGYICPVGFLSGLLERAGQRLGLAVIPPRWLDLPLTGLKYLLLGGFLLAVFSMDARSLESFIASPFNMASDARMLAFFTSPSALSLTVIAGLAGASLIVRNFWCRYLCPYGALLGLLALTGPTHIRRDAETCIGCGRCSARCPSGIEVEKKVLVRSPECIGCAECVGSCPVQGCLSFTVPGRRTVPWQIVGIGTVLVLLLVWAWAESTGHWDSQVPPAMLKRIYLMALGPM
ncbi:4Fe-4S binding protein [Pseudodesulfovibrio sp. S3]|nr:4Fe-4S binding protein [Pseudodesulfovibrio sp. S3-i]RWU02386.1 4Fe-4S binding protein [Pseudodesulfovibrio sp. S3]